MFDHLSEIGVVPILAVKSVDAGLHTCEALRAGGLNVVEVTFRTKAAADIIRETARRFPDALLGAGTLLTPDDVARAVDAGARFAVAPGCTPRVIEAALELDLPLAPGVCTPSDVERALGYGLTVLKLFPAEVMGGLRLLKALHSPYGHLGLQFIPTGGVNADNLVEYLSLPYVPAVGGTWIAPKTAIHAEDWAGITHRAREALRLAMSAKEANTASD